MARTYYETLGVSERAEPAEIRRAYLYLARRLHPDGLASAEPDDRARSERLMREVNEAWRVLGDPVRRLAYDASRRRSAPTPVGPRATGGPVFTSGTLFEEPEPEPDLTARVVRSLPWVLIVLVLGAIFVFTAYATSDRGGVPGNAGCVRIEGDVAESVACGAEGARRVRIEVLSATQCPEGTEPFQPTGRDTALCLEPG
ncbi:MAG: J domain-containing protein [Acidimicrobiales bacterium]